MDKRLEQTFHQRKYQDRNQHMKECSSPVAIRDMLIKTSQMHSELLERLTTPSSILTVSSPAIAQSCPDIAIGNVKATLVLLKTVWWFVIEMKTIFLQPTNPTHRYLPKRNENIHLHKDLQGNAYSGFINNQVKLETPQMSLHW